MIGESWSGLNDRAIEGTFVWDSSGQPFTWGPWMPSNIPNNNQDNDCVKLKNGGDVDTKQCNENRYIICQSGE